MELKIKDTLVRLVKGDITEQTVDVIVNAANSSLMGGGGVDGAIHKAGGEAILAECKTIVSEIGSLEPGRSVITTGGALPAKNVIHTVGPKYLDGCHGEYVTLEHAYSRSLDLAAENELKTIAFPSISTGAYKFPIEEAAHVAFSTIVRHITVEEQPFTEIRMVLFSDEDLSTFEQVFTEGRDTMIGT